MMDPNALRSWILVGFAVTVLLLPVAFCLRRRQELARTLEIKIPNSSDILVLLTYDAVRKQRLYRNLSRRTIRGEALWVADLPMDGDHSDAYVHAEIHGSEVVAHTWSGFRVVLNIATGAIVECRFTK